MSEISVASQRVCVLLNTPHRGRHVTREGVYNWWRRRQRRRGGEPREALFVVLLLIMNNGILRPGFQGKNKVLKMAPTGSEDGLSGRTGS
jgi:hypothetical protein